MRRLIVSTFESLCVAFVLLPTAIALLLLLNSSGQLYYFLLLIGTFLTTCFIAGGALTLVDVARNTQETANAIRRLEDAYLRDKYSQAAVAAAPSETK